MKKVYNKVSCFSKMLNSVLRHTRLKKNYVSEKQTKKMIERLSKKKYVTPKKVGLFLENYKKGKIYSYNGNLSNPKDTIIIYMHGGSYVEEAVSFQLKFAMKIAKKCSATLIVPIYPLAPKSTYKETYDLMSQLYDEILKLNKKVIFLGDSAGGGFCLSFAMYLREKKKMQPDSILLLSPWLDLTLKNPSIGGLEKFDAMCSVKGNQYAGKLWAGDLDVRDYLVSPIYGDLNNLSNLTIATGEFDIMKPDCVKLSLMLDEKKINHNYIEYKGQCHDFGICPTKEGTMLVDDFVKIINGDV